MSLPRTWRISPSLSPRRSRPARWIAPDTILPGGAGTRRRIDSAVALLPQPDSPTIAKVSPGMTWNETPSTARTMPSRVKNQVFSSATSSSGRPATASDNGGAAAADGTVSATALTPGSQAPRKARIERVAQSVAKQVDRQHRHRQHDPREQHDVIGDLKQAAPLGHDVAPARDGGRGAGAEKGQDRLCDHRRRGDEGALHQQRRQRVGHDMAPQDPEKTGA